MRCVRRCRLDRDVRRLAEHLGLRQLPRVGDGIEPRGLRLREHGEPFGAVAVEPFHMDDPLAGCLHEIPEKLRLIDRWGIHAKIPAQGFGAAGSAVVVVATDFRVPSAASGGGMPACQWP